MGSPAPASSTRTSKGPAVTRRSLKLTRSPPSSVPAEGPRQPTETGERVPGQPSRPLDGADGLVEDALAALEQRDRLAEAVLLEVRGLAVRAVGLLVVVDLVEEEDAGILEVPVGLIEATARLGPRGLDQLSHRGEHPLLLPLPSRPLRCHHVRHLTHLSRSVDQVALAIVHEGHPDANGGGVRADTRSRNLFGPYSGGALQWTRRSREPTSSAASSCES